MNIICKVFGHNWNRTDPYKQPCKRRHCLATRWQTARWNDLIAWKVTDIDKIKIR